MDRPLKIVLAEGDPVARLRLASELARLGHAVTLAADGRDLAAACRAAGPDLVLCAVDLPGLGGLDALEEVRRDSWAPAAVLMGDSWGPRERGRAARMGAACAGRPADLPDLVRSALAGAA